MRAELGTEPGDYASYEREYLGWGAFALTDRCPPPGPGKGLGDELSPRLADVVQSIGRGRRSGPPVPDRSGSAVAKRDPGKGRPR